MIYLLIALMVALSIYIYKKRPPPIPDVGSLLLVPHIHRAKSVIDSKNRKSLLDECNIPINYFPTVVATNLKGRKHEWFVLGFCTAGNVRFVYSHKGENSWSVSGVPKQVVLRAVQDVAADMVLIFHNHPNGVLEASETDLASAGELGSALHSQGVDLVEYVCARGRARQYYEKRVYRDRYGKQIRSSYPALSSVWVDLNHYYEESVEVVSGLRIALGRGIASAVNAANRFSGSKTRAPKKIYAWLSPSKAGPGSTEKIDFFAVFGNELDRLYSEFISSRKDTQLSRLTAVLEHQLFLATFLMPDGSEQEVGISLDNQASQALAFAVVGNLGNVEKDRVMSALRMFKGDGVAYGITLHNNDDLAVHYVVDLKLIDRRAYSRRIKLLAEFARNVSLEVQRK